MDLVNEKKVHYSSEACANCGCPSLEPKAARASGNPGLCPSCLNERHASLDDMRKNVKEEFELSQSPAIRSCFLRLLLSRDVDLAPAGWRTGMALGFELKSAGFALPESRKILLKARANERLLDSLLDNIYKNIEHESFTCDQMRGMDIICDQCPGQYMKVHREHRTEIC